MEILSPSRRIGLLLGPTLFLFLLVAPSPEGLSPLAQRMAAVVVLMAVFWITEAVPIAVTALYPRYWVLPPASRLPWPTATTYSFCLSAAV